MKNLILILNLLFINTLLMGQTAFQSGYVITTPGDTLAGEINFNWTSRPEEVTFRASGENNQRFTTSDLQGFKIDGGDLYQALTVDLDVSPTNPEDMLKMGEDLFEETSLFVKVLTLGSANLYQSFDQKRGRYHYFIENAQSDGPIELISGIRSVSASQPIRQQNASGAFKELDKYKGQLAFLLGDCKEVQSNIQRMPKLTENSALSIIGKYNSCNENIISYTQDRSSRGSGISLGLLLGVQLMDVNFESEGILPEDLNTPAKLVHNIGLELMFDFNDRKNLGLSFLLFHRSFKTSETFFDDRPILDGFSTLNHKYEQIALVAKANLNFGVGDSKFFISGGPGIGFASGTAGTKTFETGTVIDLIESDSDRQFLLNFGAGYQWKQLRGSIDYEFAGSMALTRVASSNGISLRISYFFLQK